jgi:hypothetical protein
MRRHNEDQRDGLMRPGRMRGASAEPLPGARRFDRRAIACRD